MDKTIRRNEICVIGLPRCDFVFSSTRTCFIAYGFRDSTLEMTILKNLLERRGIHPVEAGGALAPGQSAFCTKICSKIITSQFCIVLLNNELVNDQESPNANVNMEYGLMLGFNKYVIPFMRGSQTLPFNVAGLDTIKYSDVDFERRATEAIDQAICETQQDGPGPIDMDQVINTFLLAKGTLVARLNSDGEQNFYDMGGPLGFNLLHDFSAMNYVYLGNFMALRTDTVIWRLRKLIEVLDARLSSMSQRVQEGIVTLEQTQLVKRLLRTLRIWIVVTSDNSKREIGEAVESKVYEIEVFSGGDVASELKSIG